MECFLVSIDLFGNIFIEARRWRERTPLELVYWLKEEFMSPVFNLSEVISVKPKPLPVIMLLDVSGSMSGANMYRLHH